MATALGSFQALLLLFLALAAFGMDTFAFVDAIRQRQDAFTAAGKLTKMWWSLITGVGTILGFIFLIAQWGSGGALIVFHFVNIIAFAACAVYLVDVRPAIRAISGGGGSSGPYGRW